MRSAPDSVTCKYEDVPGDFFGHMNTTAFNNSAQNLLDIITEITDFGRGPWIGHDESWAWAAPVEDSFSDLQLYRARGAFECRRLRFDVHLWGTVNVRKPTGPQLVESLKKMAAFLQSKAAAIEQGHEGWKDDPTVDQEVARAARIAAARIAEARAANASAAEFGAGLQVDPCCSETDNPCAACASQPLMVS